MECIIKNPETFIPRTACRDCCFAQYHDITQTGCSLGRLGKFADNGAKIIEAHDNGKEFFVIEGRFCSALRPKQWQETLDFKKNQAKLYEEIKIVPDVLILGSVPETTNEKILKTYESIDKDWFNRCVIVTELTYNDINDLIKLLNISENQIPWRIDSYPKPIKQNNIISKISTQYVHVVNAGDLINHGLVKDINYQVNHLMKQKMYITEGNQGCYLTAYLAHDQQSG